MRPEVVRLLWAVAAITVAMLLLQRPASVFIRFCASALLAYMCAPLAACLQSTGIARLRSVLTVVSLAVLAVAGLILAVPAIGAPVSALMAELPEVIEWYRGTVVPWAHIAPGLDLPANAERGGGLLANALQADGDLFPQLLPSITSGGLPLLSLLGTLVLPPVLLFYFLLDWERTVVARAAFVPRRQLAQATSLVPESEMTASAFRYGYCSLCSPVEPRWDSLECCLHCPPPLSCWSWRAMQRRIICPTATTPPE